MRKISLIILVFLPSIIHAEVWTKDHSPYVIESDRVVQDLTIEKGVTVKIGNPDIYSFKIEGSLEVKGTEYEPVIFESSGEEGKSWTITLAKDSSIKYAIFRNSLGHISIRGGNISIDHVDFEEMSSCISIENAVLTINNSNFTGCGDVDIYSEGSSIDIINSNLSGNTENQGIIVRDHSLLNMSSTTIRGYRNGIMSDNSTIRAASSIFRENGTGLSSKLSDIIINSSLFNKNNTSISVFIPVISTGGEGNLLSPLDQVIIKGSDFIDSNIDIKNTSKITVDARENWWGSNFGPKKNQGNVMVDPWIKKNATCCSNVLFIPGFQASRLFLPSNQLWEPNRNADVEKLFMGRNNVSVGSIVDKGFGYKIYDSLIQMLNNLVTNKTIKAWKPAPYDWRKDQIEVAKGIVPILQSLASTSDTGRVTIVSHSNGGLVAKALLSQVSPDILDSVVFIAVPHIGTPKAIASMLYGYGQDILKGLILNKKTARQLGYDSPGAYGLLPTDYVASPGVASSSKEVNKPMELNANLLTAAKKMHDILDKISFPKIFSITGWNVRTLNSTSTETIAGDGTVVASSSDVFGNSIFFDIGKFNKKEKKSIDHANITESEPVLDTVKDIVASTTHYSEYMSKDYPVISDEYTMMMVKIFSPVNIHAYDEDGRHTGPRLYQPDPELGTFIDEDIPNSSYEELFDSKVITVPIDGAYTIKGIGSDTGTFTLKTTVMNGFGKEIEMSSFTDLPVLKDSQIELKGNKLEIDIDNDGVIDTTTADTKAFLILARKAVVKMNIPALMKKAITDKITSILNQWTPDKEKIVRNKINTYKDKGFERILLEIIKD